MPSKNLILPLVLSFSMAGAGAARAQSNIYNGHAPDPTTSSQLQIIPESQQHPVKIRKSFFRMIVDNALLFKRGKYNLHCPDELSGCKADVKKLGSAGGKELLFVGYKYISHIPGEEPAFGDYPAVHRGQVLEKTSGDMAIPVATVQKGTPTMEVVLQRAGDQPVLVLRNHSTGSDSSTWDELYLMSPQGKWEPLNQDASWNEIYDQIPPAYSMHRSYQIEFNHSGGIHWKKALAKRMDPKTGEFDPNCCPSGRVDADLSIRNGQLHVDRYAIDTNHPIEP